MRLDRDPETGRFLPGNQVAAGNRGNKKPKYANRNAEKHGLYSNYVNAREIDGGFLFIYTKRGDVMVIPPDGFFRDEQDRLRIRNDYSEILEKEFGVQLEVSEP